MTPEKTSRFLKLLPVAIILLAAAVAAAPILLHGPVGGDDFEFHLTSWMDAQHGWLHGIVYPHWAGSPNFGAGEPRFVFYPPLTWMLGAALGFVLPWTLVPAAITFLLLAGTGFAVRKLARDFLCQAAATLAGCVAICSGYALFSTYYRTAFAELAGGFWIPLLLLFALRDRAPESPGPEWPGPELPSLGLPGSKVSVWRRAFDGSTFPLALVVAGAWLSDAPVGVMACYLLAGVAVVAAITGHAWFPMLRAATAVVLGVALIGVWLVPAAWEQRWVEIQQATGATGDPGLRIENNWIFPHHADAALHGRDMALRAISWVNLSMIAAAVFCLVFLGMRHRLSRPRDSGRIGARNPRHAEKTDMLAPRWWIPLGVIPFLVMFLQLPASLPIWNLLPKLRFLQFPWRWLLVVEAPLAIFFAAAVWPSSTAKRWLRPAISVLCALAFMGATVFAAQHFFRDDPEDGDLIELLDRLHSGEGVIGTDEYAPPGSENSLVATGLQDACLTDNFDDELGVQANLDDNPMWRSDQQSCISTFAATGHRPEHLDFSINAPRIGFLILRLRSYPAWRVTVNGRPITNLQSRQDGLIALPVSQGPATVTVDWTTTPDVIAGRCVSLLAFVAVMGLWRVERKLWQVPRG